MAQGEPGKGPTRAKFGLRNISFTLFCDVKLPIPGGLELKPDVGLKIVAGLSFPLFSRNIVRQTNLLYFKKKTHINNKKQQKKKKKNET